MYESLLFLLSQVGFDVKFESFLSIFDGSNLERIQKEHKISSVDWEYLERVKEYMLKETQLSEVDVVGFMVYMFIPIKLKSHPEYKIFEPEAVLDNIFHETHPKLNVVDEEN